MLLCPLIITTTTQVWFLLMAIAFLDEQLSLWVAANTLLSVIGIVLAIVEPLLEGQHLEFNIGYLYLLFASITSSGAIFIGKVCVENDVVYMCMFPPVPC